MLFKVSCALLVGLSGAADCGVDGVGDCFAPPSQPYRLTYFNGRGLGELTRTVFALASKLPGSGYEDRRLKGDEFAELKKTGILNANLNRMPILEHEGHVIGQSTPIARYVAREHGLMGNDKFEAATIDAFCAHLDDVKAAFRKLQPYGSKLTDEEKAEANKVWFDTPASPSIEGRKERQLRWFLGWLEELSGDDGYVVGGRFSLADACLYNVLGEYEPSVEGGEPFGNKAATDKVLGEFPNLNKAIDTFRQSPGIAAWLAVRGEQGF